jgi:hypothetical protein
MCLKTASTYAEFRVLPSSPMTVVQSIVACTPSEIHATMTSLMVSLVTDRATGDVNLNHYDSTQQH